MHEELNVSHRRRCCSHCFCPEVTAPRSSFKIQHSRFINVLSTIIFYISSSRNWMCSRLSVPFKVTFQGPVTADTGRIQTQYFTKRRDTKWRESQFCVSELFRWFRCRMNLLLKVAASTGSPRPAPAPSLFSNSSDGQNQNADELLCT